MAKKTVALLSWIASYLLIQCFCFSSSLASQKAPTKFVRLLFPLTKGTELDILATYINKPKLYSIAGETFVLAAELPDAVVAYRLGKSIQLKIKLPFVLAYDPGHPQSDFRWMQTKHSSKRVSIELKPQRNHVSFSARQLSSQSSVSVGNLSVPSTQNKIASKKDSRLGSDSRQCVPVDKCLSTIGIPNILMRDKNQSNSFADSGLILSESKLKSPPFKANFLPRMLGKHFVKPLSTVILSDLGISKGRIDEPGKADKPVSVNAVSFNSDSGENIENPSQVDKLGSFPAGKENSSSIFLNDSIVVRSPSTYFSLADPALVYIFIRISDEAQLASLFKARKPQAFYRIKLNLYAQIAVHNSSRVGKQVLDTDLSAIAKLGFVPIPLIRSQVLAMV